MSKKHGIIHSSIRLFIKELVEKILVYSLRIDAYPKKLLFIPFFCKNNTKKKLSSAFNVKIDKI